MRRASVIDSRISGKLASGAMPITATVVGLVLGVAIFLSVWIASEDSEADRAFRVTVAYQNGVADLMSSIQDAEIGQRGYLLTGDELYLNPYNVAMASLDNIIDKLAEVDSTPVQTSNIAALRSLVAQKKSELQQSVELRRLDEPASIALMRTGQGKILMDGIRAVIHQMKEDGVAQLATRLEAVALGKRRMQTLLVIFAILAGGLSILVVRATVTRAKAAEKTRDELLGHADRRLMAVMAADLVGYSRMMEIDEADTLNRLKSARHGIDAIIEDHSGVIITTAGDSIVAAFSSALSAIDCAIEIQKHLGMQNVDRSENDRLRFRIGMNVGDVIIDNGDIFGDTVNIAARLESISEPGGICVSRSVRDHVRKHRKLKFEDAGFQRVKNISKPISTFRVYAED
jgi:class 3 adenylate cyclase